MVSEQYSGDEYLTWDKYRVVVDNKRTERTLAEARAMAAAENGRKKIEVVRKPRRAPTPGGTVCSIHNGRKLDGGTTVYLIRVLRMNDWTYREIVEEIRNSGVRISRHYVATLCSKSECKVWLDIPWPPGWDDKYCKKHTYA